MFNRYLWDVTWWCHTLSAVLSEGVCKRRRGNARCDSGEMAGMMGVQVPQLLGSSACAGSLLCAPIAQQVVCKELWLFVCLKGNLRLDGGHPQDGDWVVANPGTSLI